MAKLIEWLKEQSTQKAILAALAAVGVNIAPEQAATIFAGFLALYSLIAGFRDRS